MAYEDQREELEGLTAELVADTAFTAEQISAASRCAYMEATAYTRRDVLDAQLLTVAAEIAVLKLNRLGSEGAASLNYSGVSEAYVDGYPANIRAALNMRRRLKVL